MPPAGADVGVLRRNDPPAAADLVQHAQAHALARRLAERVVQDFSFDPEARMQDRDIGREKAYVHLRRPARARPVRASGAVQALHQVAETCAAHGPGAIHGDELGIVDERLGHAVGIVGVPSRVEAVFELADGVFVGVRHGGWLPGGPGGQRVPPEQKTPFHFDSHQTALVGAIAKRIAPRPSGCVRVRRTWARRCRALAHPKFSC